VCVCVSYKEAAVPHHLLISGCSSMAVQTIK